MKPLIRLKKTRAPDNVYGHDQIEVLHFNYDGKGGAIVRYGKGRDLESIAKGDLDLILFGDPRSGVRWYRVVQR